LVFIGVVSNPLALCQNDGPQNQLIVLGDTTLPASVTRTAPAGSYCVYVENESRGGSESYTLTIASH
jgi:hypothetical protein